MYLLESSPDNLAVTWFLRWIVGPLFAVAIKRTLGCPAVGQKTFPGAQHGKVLRPTERVRELPLNDLRSSRLPLNRLPDVCGAIRYVDAFRFTTRQKPDYLAIHEFHILLRERHDL
jgi:hypothetical protein